MDSHENYRICNLRPVNDNRCVLIDHQYFMFTPYDVYSLACILFLRCNSLSLAGFKLKINMCGD